MSREQATRKFAGAPPNAAAGGSAGLSLFASFVGLCCVGPWSVVLFGVSGAVALARFQPYRPLILAAAAGLLGWAFWRAYRKPARCADGACARKPSIWLKATLWGSALLLVAAVFAEDLQGMLADPTPPGLQGE
jgi:mercuric ion transport protein